MIKCRYADKYKAIRAPKCGGKDGPCNVCASKWAVRQHGTALDVVKKK